MQQLKPWQNIEWLKKLYPPQGQKDFIIWSENRVVKVTRLFWDSMKKGTYARNHYNGVR